MRWEHPERGLPPLAFVPIAEETGLIFEFGAWVLNEACAQAAAWRSSVGLRIQVCVNVSGRQLANPQFAQTVAATVERSGSRGARSRSRSPRAS